jgi:hypothetical protein
MFPVSIVPSTAGRLSTPLAGPRDCRKALDRRVSANRFRRISPETVMEARWVDLAAAFDPVVGIGFYVAKVGLASLEQLCQQVTANVDAAKSAKTAAEAATNATRIAQEQLKLSEMRYQASLRAAESAAESAAQASRLAQAEFKISKRAYARVFTSVKAGEGGGRVFTCVLPNLSALPAKLDR